MMKLVLFCGSVEGLDDWGISRLGEFAEGLNTDQSEDQCEGTRMGSLMGKLAYRQQGEFEFSCRWIGWAWAT